MTRAVMGLLQRLLVQDYYGLRERLARRFGSADFASEVLHEAWLRLDRTQAGASAAALRNPRAYLYRVALNVAIDRKRRETSRLDRAEVDTILRQAVDEADPGRIAEARSDLASLAAVIDTFPARRRAIFVAARLEGLPYKIIAERLGITVRVVDGEMKAALDALAAALEQAGSLEQNVAGPGGSGPRISSTKP